MLVHFCFVLYCTFARQFGIWPIIITSTLCLLLFFWIYADASIWLRDLGLYISQVQIHERFTWELGQDQPIECGAGQVMGFYWWQPGILAYFPIPRDSKATESQGVFCTRNSKPWPSFWEVNELPTLRTLDFLTISIFNKTEITMQQTGGARSGILEILK